MELKDKIARLRKINGLTQVELAKKIGITTRALQNYEMGTRVPKIDTLTKVAYALGVDVNELVTDSEHFIIEAKEKYGSRGKAAAEELIKNANALFAGGEISEEDKQNVMEALQEAYWRAKIKNKKYTPKKYLKETEDKNADENKSEKRF